MAGRRSVFNYVKGLFGGEPSRLPSSGRRPPVAPRPIPAASLTPKPTDPDALNPATITHVGRVPDGRELVRTLGLGSYLVDRELPTICYFLQGHVAEIPTAELRHLFTCLMEKRHFDEFRVQYVDLLNAASFELQARSGRIKRPSESSKGKPGAAKPLPRRPMGGAALPAWPDAENPATITRVGRFQGDAELIMTLGLGTFVVHREPPRLRYFDRGREWEVPPHEVNVLIDSLQAKLDTAAHQASYDDLLQVAKILQQQRENRRRP